MKIRHYVLIAMLFLLAIFVTANWPLVAATSNLNFLIREAEAPLGVVLCGVIIFQSILFIVFLAHIERAAALESRNRNKEIEKLRKIADDKEASRIYDLEERIEDRFEELYRILDQVVREESLTDLREAMEREREEEKEK